MQEGYHKGGVGKTARMQGTRVTKHGSETPISGSPQKKDATMKGGRVSDSPGLSRKNDPKGRSAGSLGLSVGQRVTNKKTGKK